MTEVLTKPETDRVLIPILNADDLRATATKALDEARRRFDQIEAVPLEDVSAATILDPWDHAAILLEDAFGPISLLNSVHPMAAVRDAGDDALLEESSFITSLFQDEALF